MLTPHPGKNSLAPNIIFIMADDLGYGDLGCYGATKIPTPHIDRIAAAGMRFTDAHASAALCTPSRYSVLTGRYCWRSSLKSGVLWGFSPPLIETERLTVAGMLREQDYITAAIGKWHLGFEWRTMDGSSPDPQGDGRDVDYTAPLGGGPTALSFNYSFNMAASLDMPPYCFIENDCVVTVPTVEKDPYNPQQRPGLMSPGWQDELVDVIFAQQAVSWIDAHMSGDDHERPFFLYLTPAAPHRPCMPPDFIRGASQAGDRGDMVALFDWLVGQIDERLHHHGLVENTLLIITSDNGAKATDINGRTWGHKPNGDLRGQKADVWEGGHREPFIVRWPGHVTPGSHHDGLVCLGDLPATCAAVIGAELADDSAPDSVSILPLLLGQKQPVRDSLIHHSGDGMFSIRRGPWKLIEGLGSGGFTAPARVKSQPDGPQGQLYYLREDPAEEHNRWLEEPALVEDLRAALAAIVE
jgi:arylsulfatase A-like enzyme